MFFRVYLLVFIIFCTSCHSTPKHPHNTDTNEPLVCDQLMHNAIEKHSDTKVIKAVESASGAVLSYAWTGTNYAVETIWDVTAGTVVFVALCSPGILASALSTNTNPYAGIGVGCLPGKLNTLASPPLGRIAYKRTKSWRCPDLGSFSRDLQASYKCYAQSTNKKEIKHGLQSLEALAASRSLIDCFPAEGRASLFDHLDILSKRLNSTATVSN